MDGRRREQARMLLAQGRTTDALGLYEDHLADNDDDHEARLEYGLARLIAGDRDGFVSIGMEYAPCMSAVTLGRLGDRFRSLWAEYAGTCARLARASAVGASVALACQAGGCSGSPVRPDAAPASDTATIEQPYSMAAEPEADPPPAPPPATVAQAADASTNGEATGPGPSGVDTPKPKPGPKPKPLSDMPKTRYVAVHLSEDDIF